MLISAKGRFKRIQISGANSLWRTVHAISLGTTLKQLEQLNRKPFQLAGFDFDYSGTVLSWSHGELEGVLDPVILRLDPSQVQSQQTDYRSVLGDGSSSGFWSSSAAKTKPAVYQLIWLFPLQSAKSLFRV